MKKKLLVLLLIIAVAAFVFTGCTPPTPSEGEGEGEGEGEIEVDIEGAVAVGARTYVAGGSHDITVTLSEAVSGFVTVDVSDCSGDYGKGPIFLFSEDGGKTWTGSIKFNCAVTSSVPCAPDTCEVGDCCYSVVTVNLGDEILYQDGFIVDCEDPYAEIEISTANCGDICDAGCALVFKPVEESTDPCGGSYTCCGDDCTDIEWSIAIYKYDDVKHDKCCNLTVCAEPVDSVTGSGCPIEWTSKCLEVEENYLVFGEISDLVGHAIESDFYKVTMTVDGDGKCELVVSVCDCDQENGFTCGEPIQDRIIVLGSCIH